MALAPHRGARQRFGQRRASRTAGFERWGEAIHMIALPYLGLPLLENAELDALGRACREEGRWEFFVTIAPWRIHGTTSSSVSPLAIF